MQDPKGRASPPFDEIRPGQSLGTFRYELTPELVDRHRRATGQEPYPDPGAAPVSMLAADGVNLADKFWDISQSVHSGQRLEVVRLPRIGERLAVHGVARDKFTKKGRRYVVTDTTTSDESGAVVARGVTTGVLVYAEGESGNEERRPAHDGAREEEAAPTVIEQLGPLVREMTFENMLLYEPPGEKSIHTDDELARQAGLPAAIATGTLFLAYVFDLLYRRYGVESLVGTGVDVRIRLPVFAGDRIETEADLLSRDGPTWEHVVRCRSPLGDAIVGRAWVPAK
jgi:acyl dehydratase